MGHPIDWKDATLGDKPVCLVGAGFQKAALEKPRPSTKKIIEETVQNNGDQFPILSALCNSKIPLSLDLSYMWDNFKFLSDALYDKYNQIVNDYSSLNNKITAVISEYKKLGVNRLNVINVIFELELKKMIAYHYDCPKMGAFNKSVISNMRSIISQDKKFTWISLNYDIVLEKLLVCEIYKKEEFDFNFRKVKYAFNSLLTNKSLTNDDSEHILIKPHGSLNVVFETDNQNTYNIIHKIYYKTLTPSE